MDGDFSEKLRTVLSDPEALARISTIAGSLSGGKPSDEMNAQSAGSDDQSAAPSAQASALSEFGTARDPRVALLYSLKPLLRQEKQGKIDELARAMAAISLFKNLKK